MFQTIRGRRIKIDVAESEGDRRRGGQRGLRDRDSNYDSERTLGDWRSGPKRLEKAHFLKYSVFICN